VRRGRARFQSGRHDLGDADYEEALKLEPNRPAIWAALGDQRAQLGRKEKALEAFARAFEHGANDPWLWHRKALLEADRGDEAAYHRTCADMARRFEKTTDPETLRVMANVLSLAPGGLPVLADLTRRVEKVVAASPVVPKIGHLQALGYLQFRASDHAAAVKTLERAIKVENEDSGNAWTGLVLALAYDHLGKKDQARARLAKSAAWLDKRGPSLDWENRLHLELLRREAERRIGTKP
jgi:Flp pilus assembly protein TadD